MSFYQGRKIVTISGRTALSLSKEKQRLRKRTPLNRELLKALIEGRGRSWGNGNRNYENLSLAKERSGRPRLGELPLF